MVSNLLYALLLFVAVLLIKADGFIRSDRPLNDVDDQIPPPYKEYAKMARYIVHKSNWTAFGTISTSAGIRGFPMVNVISIADSPLNGKSTGNVYFFLTMLDFTGQDLAISNQLTMLFSMDQDLYCTSRNIDSMEPTCARIMLSGNAIRVNIDHPEFAFANASMFSRHPAAVNWTKAHDFFLCKLNIKQIVVLDYYGGPHYVPINDYYSATNEKKVSPRRKSSRQRVPFIKAAASNDELTIKIKKNIRTINIQEI